MKLTAYLVDDEPLALERLRRLLNDAGSVEVVGSTTEPEAAVQALHVAQPDVCFLDIEMPRLTGFDVLARLPKQPIVVFTTAYDQYALRAFGVNSVDYLLKPIEPEALQRALDKIHCLRNTDKQLQPNFQETLKHLKHSLEELAGKYPERIASRLGDRLWFLDLPQVTHFYAENKLTYAVSAGKSYCVDYSIMDLEKKLDPRKFVRIHRSTIVNVHWIKDASSLPGGSLNLRLRDARETNLTVARDRVHDFKLQLGC